MNLLLDTHTLIWLLEGSESLSAIARTHIEKSDHTCFISVASFWEIAVKISIGKLQMGMSMERLEQLVWENGIEILPIQVVHTRAISRLPFHHKDPFDRIIAVQAIEESMNLIGCDTIFDAYFENSLVKRIW